MEYRIMVKNGCILDKFPVQSMITSQRSKFSKAYHMVFYYNASLFKHGHVIGILNTLRAVHGNLNAVTTLLYIAANTSAHQCTIMQMSSVVVCCVVFHKKSIIL